MTERQKKLYEEAERARIGEIKRQQYIASKDYKTSFDKAFTVARKQYENTQNKDTRKLQIIGSVSRQLSEEGFEYSNFIDDVKKEAERHVIALKLSKAKNTLQNNVYGKANMQKRGLAPLKSNTFSRPGFNQGAYAVKSAGESKLYGAAGEAFGAVDKEMTESRAAGSDLAQNAFELLRRESGNDALSSAKRQRYKMWATKGLYDSVSGKSSTEIKAIRDEKIKATSDKAEKDFLFNTYNSFISPEYASAAAAKRTWENDTNAYGKLKNEVDAAKRHFDAVFSQYEKAQLTAIDAERTYGLENGASRQEFERARISKNYFASESKKAKEHYDKKLSEYQSGYQKYQYALKTLYNAEEYEKLASDPEFNIKSSYFDKNSDDSLYRAINGVGSDIGMGISSSAQVKDIREKVLTDSEKKVYTYLYNTRGKTAAHNFIKEIEALINLRQAELIGTDGGIVEGALWNVSGGLESGFINTLRGVSELGKGVVDAISGGKANLTEEYFFPTTSQMVANQYTEDADGFVKGMYQTLYGASNMATPLALSAIPYAGPYLGKAAFFSQAFGASYSDAVNGGKEQDEAFLYGLTSAGLEFASETAVGGLSFMGKSGLKRIGAEDTLGNAFSKMFKTEKGKAAARIVSSYASSSISEGFEEAISAIGDPILRSAFLSEKFQLNAGDVTEQALLGITTALIINAPSSGVSASVLKGDISAALFNIDARADINPIQKYRLKQDVILKGTIDKYYELGGQHEAFEEAKKQAQKKGYNYEVGEFDKAAFEIGKLHRDADFAAQQLYNFTKKSTEEGKNIESVTEEILTTKEFSEYARQALGLDISDEANTERNSTAVRNYIKALRNGEYEARNLPPINETVTRMLENGSTLGHISNGIDLNDGLLKQFSEVIGEDFAKMSRGLYGSKISAFVRKMQNQYIAQEANRLFKNRDEKVSFIKRTLEAEKIKENLYNAGLSEMEVDIDSISEIHKSISKKTLIESYNDGKRDAVLLKEKYPPESTKGIKEEQYNEADEVVGEENITSAQAETPGEDNAFVTRAEKGKIKNVKLSDVEKYNSSNFGEKGIHERDNIAPDAVEKLVNEKNPRAQSERLVDGVLARLYEKGYKGEKYNAAYYEGVLSSAQAQRIYNAGVKDAKDREQNVFIKDAHIIKDDLFKAAKISDADVRLIETLSSFTGRNVRFADLEKGVNAYIDPSKGEIVINVNAKWHVRTHIIHEAIHSLRMSNPAEYNKLANTVEDIIYKAGLSNEFKDYRVIVSKTYLNELTDENGRYKYGWQSKVKEETICDVFSNVISNSALIKKLGRENASGLMRGVYAIQDFISSIKEKFTGGEDITREAKVAYKLLSSRADSMAESFAESIKKAFPEGVESKRSAKTQVKDNSGVKKSVVLLDNGNTYVTASQKRNVITGNDRNQWRRQITDFFKELIPNGKSIDITTLEGDVLTISINETANKARDDYQNVNGISVKLTDDEFRVKLRTEAHIDEIVETSLKDKNGKVPDTKSHSFAKDGFSYRTAYFQDYDGQYYKVRLSIGHKNNVATVYNVGKIQKDSIPSATKIVAVVGSQPLGKLSNSIIHDNGENVKDNSGVKHSRDFAKSQSTDVTLDDIKVIQSIGRKSINEFTSDEIKKTEAFARRYFKEMGVKSPFFRAWFGDWRANDSTKHIVSNIHAYSEDVVKNQRGTIINNDTHWDIVIGRNGISNTKAHSGSEKKSVMGLAGIKSLLENAILLDTETHEHHSNNPENDNISFDHKFYALGVDEGGNTALYKITVEEYFQSKSEPNNRRFHNLRYIDIDNGIKKVALVSTDALLPERHSGGSAKETLATNYSIADLFGFVKQYDKDFKYNAVNPLLLNADGTPKVVYHGTNADFWTFNAKTGSYFFSESYDYAEAMAEERKGNRIIEAYLRMRKPYTVKLAANEFSNPNFENKHIRYAKENGYDGVIFGNITDNDFAKDTFFVVFEPTQIKSATDNIGTFDGENPDIRYSKELNVHEIGDEEESQKSANKEAEKVDKALMIRQARIDRWRLGEGFTDKASDGKGGVKSLSAIVNEMTAAFGLKSSSGAFASAEGENSTVQYNSRAKSIRTKLRNDLPSICSGIALHIDSQLDLTGEIMRSAQGTRGRVSDKKAFSKYENELKDLVSEYNGSAKSLVEAMCEYVRLYLINPDKIEERCPDFTKLFKSKLKDSQTSEELSQAIEKCSSILREYLSQKDVQRSTGAIMSQAEFDKQNFDWRKSLRDKKTKLYTTMVDSYYSIKRAIRAAGGDFKSGSSAYVLAENSLLTSAQASYIVNEAMVDMNGRKIGESLSDIRADVLCTKEQKKLGFTDKQKEKDFNEYLVVRHAVEWLPREKRVFADDVANRVEYCTNKAAELEAKYSDFAGLANRVYAYATALTDEWLVKGGAISAKQARKYKQLYPCYVPFYRLKEDQRFSGRSSGKNLTNLKNPIEVAYGSGANIRAPFESLMIMTKNAVEFARRNAASLALAEEFTTDGALPGVMERVYSDDEISKFKNLAEETGMSFTSDSLTEFFGKEENKENRGFTPAVSKSQRVFSVWRNGKQEFYRVYDVDLYNAVANLQPAQINFIVRGIGKVMAVSKSLITTWNPLFLGSNLWRDFMTFCNNTNTEPTLFHALLGYFYSLKQIVSRDEMFQVYRALGGGGANLTSVASEDLTKSVKLKKKRFGIRKILSFYTTVNEIAEALPRLTEFRNTLQQKSEGNYAADLQRAIYESQDVTTNFKRSGTGGQYANKILMFSNAAVQGIDKFYRTYRDEGPKQIALRLSKAVIRGILFTALVQHINRDDEAEEAYRHLSSYIKNNYDCFYIGDGKFIKIPKEREIAILRTFIMRTADYIFDGDKEAFADFGGYIMENITPPFIPDIENWLNPVEALKDLGQNSALGAIFDIAVNEDFKGSEIVPDYMNDLSNEFEKYDRNTSELSIVLAKKLYEFTRTDISPMQIDHFIKSYGGWVGTFVRGVVPSGDISDGKSVFRTIIDNLWTASGIGTRYVADARYSTDLLSNIYDCKEKANAKFTLKPTGQNAYELAQYGKLESFCKNYNKVSRAVSDSETQRVDRLELLRYIEAFDKEESVTDKFVNKLYDAVGAKEMYIDSYSYPKSGLWKKSVKNTEYTVNITPELYTEYCLRVDDYVDAIRALVMKNDLSDAKSAVILIEASSKIQDTVKSEMISKYGKATKGSTAASNAIRVKGPDDIFKNTKASLDKELKDEEAYREALNRIIEENS